MAREALKVQPPTNPASAAILTDRQSAAYCMNIRATVGRAREIL
jgi:hypothetical protein